MYKYGGRGIILYVSNKLTCVKKEIEVSFHECLVVEVALQTGKVITLGVFYRSPNSNQENCSKLLDYISEICISTNQNTIILGDFNLPRINWPNYSAPPGSYEESFIECVMDNFLCQHVGQNTRIREGQQSNILDLVFTKMKIISVTLKYLILLGRVTIC